MPGTVVVLADNGSARINPDCRRRDSAGIIDRDRRRSIRKLQETMRGVFAVPVDSHKVAGRVNIPNPRVNAAGYIIRLELPRSDDVSVVAFRHISVQTHDGISIRRRTSIHGSHNRLRRVRQFAAASCEARVSEASTPEADHRSHEIEIVVATVDGSIGPDALRDSTGMAWE